MYFYAGGQWNTVKAANASTADYSNNASTANYAKNAINTITRSGNTFTATRFDGTTFTFSQQNSTYTNGEGLSLSNGTFSINKNASTVAYATKAGSASSATNATNAGSATNAGTANFASTAANGIENITRSGKTFTVTRQDGSTFTFDQQDDNQTYKAGEGLSLNTGTFSINKDASTVKYATQAGSAANATCATNASSVGGFTVGKSVPSNAVFTDTTYSNVTSATAGLAPAGGSGTTKYLRQDGSWQVPPDNNTTYGNMTSATAGLAPAGGSGTTKYLRQDGTWQVPPDNNTTYPSFSTASNGLVNKPTNATTAAYLKGNNTWAIPTASEVGAIATTAKGAANGVAELDSSGKVPSTQLPSYVDDVIEGYYYNEKFYKEAAHTTEIPGESGKIYVDLSTDKTYRWGGSSFVVISETLALGETSSTAYRGDRGKIAYDHSQAAHAPSNAQPNQNAFSNVKVGSTTIAADTTTDTIELVAGSNVTLTPDATNDKVTITATDTTYSNMTSATAGLAPAGGSGTTKYLRQDGTWAIPPDNNTTYTNGTGLSLSGNTFSINQNASTVAYATNAGSATSAANATCATNSSSVGGFTVGKSVPANAVFTDTTYANVTSAAAGLAPAGGSGTTKYLRQDGSWQVPPDNNTTYGNMTSAAAGLAPAGGSGTTKYLRQDGSWQVPPNDNTTYDLSAYINNVTTSGSGNAVTGFTKSGNTLTLKKDTTFPTSNTTYADMTTAEYSTGTSTTTRVLSPKRLKEIFGMSTASSATNAASANYATSAGNATCATNSSTAEYAINAGSATNAASVGGFTVGKSVPSNAVFTDTTYAVVSTTANGLAPKVTSTSGFLKGDGTWATPANTTYSDMTTAEFNTGTSTTTRVLSPKRLKEIFGLATASSATNSSTAEYAINAGSATNASSVGGFTVGKSVPSNAVFTDTTYANMTSAAAGLAPAGGSGTTKYLRQDGSWQVPPNDNTTYGNMTSAAAGLAPAGGSGTTKYLRQDGSWQVPPNTTYGNMTSAAAGLAPAGGSGTTKFLRQDGSWQVPSYPSIPSTMSINEGTAGTVTTARTMNAVNLKGILQGSTYIYSYTPCVEADFDFGELASTTYGDETYNQ